MARPIARRTSWFRGVVNNDTTEHTDGLPQTVGIDAELEGMMALLDEAKRIEKRAGVQARERAIHWLSHRLDEDDRKRMEAAQDMGDVS